MQSQLALSPACVHVVIYWLHEGKGSWENLSPSASSAQVAGLSNCAIDDEIICRNVRRSWDNLFVGGECCRLPVGNMTY